MEEGTDSMFEREAALLAATESKVDAVSKLIEQRRLPDALREALADPPLEAKDGSTKILAGEAVRKVVMASRAAELDGLVEALDDCKRIEAECTDDRSQLMSQSQGAEEAYTRQSEELEECLALVASLENDKAMAAAGEGDGGGSGSPSGGV